MKCNHHSFINSYVAYTKSNMMFHTNITLPPTLALDIDKLVEELYKTISESIYNTMQECKVFEQINLTLFSE